MMTLEELDFKLTTYKGLKFKEKRGLLFGKEKELFEWLGNLRIGSFDLTEKKETKASDEILEMIKNYTVKNNERPECLYLPKKMIERLKAELPVSGLYGGSGSFSELKFWGFDLRVIEDYKHIFGNKHD